jgi:hypothetical protein
MSDHDENPPPIAQPAKLEAAAAAYGWLAHIAEMCQHAMTDLALYVPEEQREAATGRARARAGAFHLGLRYGEAGMQEIPE